MEETQAAEECPEAWVETNPAVMEVTQAAEECLEAWVETNPAVMEEVTQTAEECLEAWVETNPAAMEEVTLDRADMAEETLAAEGRQGVREVTMDLEALEAMEVTQAQAHPEASSHIQCLLLNSTNI